jgi:predicted GIY-YIG superfamily endonuclease
MSENYDGPAMSDYIRRLQIQNEDLRKQYTQLKAEYDITAADWFKDRAQLVEYEAKDGQRTREHNLLTQENRDQTNTIAVIRETLAAMTKEAREAARDAARYRLIRDVYFGEALDKGMDDLMANLGDKNLRAIIESRNESNVETLSKAADIHATMRVKDIEKGTTLGLYAELVAAFLAGWNYAKHESGLRHL